MIFSLPAKKLWKLVKLRSFCRVLDSPTIFYKLSKGSFFVNCHNINEKGHSMDAFNTDEVLRNLASCKPVFDTLPDGESLPRTIIGLDCETGTGLTGQSLSDTHKEKLPTELLNGGRIYIDCDQHVEFCTPETRDPLEATLYYEACKLTASRRALSTGITLHNHTSDWFNGTFGTHVSLFTQLHRNEWGKLRLYFVCAPLLLGAGRFDQRGRFCLSQRAAFISENEGTETTQNRALTNLRHEPHSNLSGWDRMHIIHLDPHMIESAAFLTIGITNLVLECAESGLLPILQYNDGRAVEDHRLVSESLGLCHLQGRKGIGPRDPLGILWYYYEAARTLGGRDFVTDLVLALWKDTMEKLEGDWSHLYGRLDWATKFYLVKQLSLHEQRREWALASMDMEYHCMSEDESLYHYLRGENKVERLFSDRLIEYAIEHPPKRTRAYARGKAVECCQKLNNGWRVMNLNKQWDKLSMAASVWGKDVQINGVWRNHHIIDIPDPFNPYPEIVKMLWQAFGEAATFKQ